METKERVIFRKWRSGDVIAWLPDNPANRGMVDAYEHIGQHGEGDYYGCLAATKLASPEEYADLLNELTGIGYDLRVVKKLIR